MSCVYIHVELLCIIIRTYAYECQSNEVETLCFSLHFLS